MLTTEQNELLCRVGPETDMGRAMRRYWLPALLATDLPHPDCDPKRIDLLGESFVAFRDTQGRIGILDEACRHRSASLALGRVEDCGIRCIYHGWKFAYDGTVLETPNVADPAFKTRFRARAWPACEAGGLIWVYLGPADREPAFPRYSWFDLPAANVLATAHLVDCNYVQILEGLVDSSHLGILHMDGLKRSSASDLGFARKINSMQFNLAPSLEVEETGYGFNYAALRAIAGDDGARTEARVAAFVAPCIVFNPNGDLITAIVPNDDRSSTFFHVFWDPVQPIGEEPLRSRQLAFVGLDDASLRQSGLDRASRPGDRPAGHNGFHQDREAMRCGRTFSGLAGLIQEDVAVSVSGGAVRDRAREVLSAADIAIGRMYRTLLGTAQQVRAGGDPIGIGGDIDASRIKGVNARLTPGQKWQSLLS
jgi:phenylpropionate dioxygenase-like ring-hydroxylating dioxygenase large terminal subunit